MLLSKYKPIHFSFNHLNKILHSTKDYYPSNPRKKRKRNLTTLIEQNPSTIPKNKHSTGNLKHLSHSQRSRSKFNINTRSTHRKKPYPRYYSRLEPRGRHHRPNNYQPPPKEKPRHPSSRIHHHLRSLKRNEHT